MKFKEKNIRPFDLMKKADEYFRKDCIIEGVSAGALRSSCRLI